MRIAIVGGTGTLGRHITAVLGAREREGTREHELRVLSRTSGAYPIDLRSGAGLAQALHGCDVVVDASNAQRGAAAVLVDGSRRLLEAERTAGVRHHVGVSIIGCDQVPMSYYRTKTEQERVIEQGAVPWSIVRATQFHELLDTMFAMAARWHVLPLPPVRLQTVASAEVARAIADIAGSEPRRARVTVAGPEIADVRGLARVWRAATGRHPLTVPIMLPGRIGRELRAGALTDASPDVRGTTSFTDWLTTRAG